METTHFNCSVCNIPCSKSCSHCKKVNYCSVQHQKEDRAKHKPTCFPAVIKQNLEFGRFLEATRDIKAGETIFVDEMILMAPAGLGCLRGMFPLCLGCSISLPGQFTDCENVCEKCKWPLCSSNCPEIEWHHNNECKIFTSKKLYPSELRFGHPAIHDAIHILRGILLEEKDPLKWTLLNELKPTEVSHHIGELKMITYFLQDFCGINISKETIEKFYGILVGNGLSDKIYGIVNFIPVPGVSMCLAALNRYASLLNHSCIPNTKPTNVNKTTKAGKTYQDSVLLAAVNIKEGDMLTQLYGNEDNYFLGVVERRKSLWDQYKFWCSCERCKDSSELGTFASAIKCQEIKRAKNGGKKVLCPGYYLPQDPLNIESLWICNNEECKISKNYEEISPIVNKVEAQLFSVSSNPKLMMSLLENFEKTELHENHILLNKYRFRVLRELYNESKDFPNDDGRRKEVLKKLYKLAKSCYTVGDKLWPGLTDHKGILLFYLAEVERGNLNIDNFLDPSTPYCKLEAECKECLNCYAPETEAGKMYSILKKRENQRKTDLQELATFQKLSNKD